MVPGPVLSASPLIPAPPRPGKFSFPCKGDKFDGHDFIPGALQRGVGALVAAADWHRRHNPSLPPELAVVLVPDTLQALGDLAHFWRSKFSGPIIAITGSCGKTTTKEMVAQVLEPQIFRIEK